VLGLAGTALATAQVGTLRTRLLKLSGVVTLSVRRVRIALSSVFPLQHVFERGLLNDHQHWVSRAFREICGV